MISGARSERGAAVSTARVVIVRRHARSGNRRPVRDSRRRSTTREVPDDVSAITGTLSVEPFDGGTRVTIRFDAELRRVPGLPTLARKLAERSRSELDAILDSYHQAAMSGPGSGRGSPERFWPPG